MSEESVDIDGADMEQIKIVLNTLYLCIGFAMKRIAVREGAEAAAEFKEQMLEALKGGDINMAMLEDTKTFDFVIAKIEALTSPAMQVSAPHAAAEPALGHG